MRIGSVHGSRGCATASWALGKVEKLCLHMSRSSWSKVHDAVWSTPSVHVCLQLSRTSESGVGVSSEQSQARRAQPLAVGELLTQPFVCRANELRSKLPRRHECRRDSASRPSFCASVRDNVRVPATLIGDTLTADRNQCAVMPMSGEKISLQSYLCTFG